MVRAVSDWLVGSWGLWCRIVAELGCIGCAAGMVAGDNECNWVAEVVEEYGCLAEVVGVDWRQGCVAFGPAPNPAAAHVGEGCRRYIVALPASRAPC
jgi:hypothetical protein